MSGFVRLHHQNGIAAYNVTRAEYGFIDDELYVEIDADSASEHFLSIFGPLSLGLCGLAIRRPEISLCHGRDFVLPTSQNEADEGPDRFTNLYLGEHYDVDRNYIRFFAENGVTIIEWRGVAPDVQYYDQRAKDSPIEARCSIVPGLFRRTRH